MCLVFKIGFALALDIRHWATVNTQKLLLTWLALWHGMGYIYVWDRIKTRGVFIRSVGFKFSVRNRVAFNGRS